MKKFNLPFDSYELLGPTVMQVEIAKEIGYYKQVFDNPIYYKHALQYRHGNIYRAIFGYEEMWDEEYETALVENLRYYYEHQKKKLNYYTEEIVFRFSQKVVGLKWKRGVKPAVEFRTQFTKRVSPATRATARVNLLDKPHHVDIEFADGEIYTVSFIRYLKWKEHCIRRKDHADLRTKSNSPAKQNGADAKNAERTEASGIEGTCSEKPSRAPNDQLLDLRKAFRRLVSLSEARKKAQTNLV